jgi:fumarate reductase flavoprotein subunit
MRQSVQALADAMRVPPEAFAAELSETEALKTCAGRDRYGRQFAPGQHFAPPFHAVKVTGALFHTQGGLLIDAVCRVKRKDDTVIPNLFAAGGAAVGVSGSTAAGYLSGNGLLTATVLGRLAGQAAAQLVR